MGFCLWKKIVLYYLYMEGFPKQGVEPVTTESRDGQAEIATQAQEFLSGNRQFMGIDAQKVIVHLIDSGQTQVVWEVMNGKLGKFNSEHERNNLRPNYNSFAVVAFSVFRDKNNFDDAEKILNYWRDHKDEIDDNNFDFDLNARSFELITDLSIAGLSEQAERIFSKMTEGDVKKSSRKIIDTGSL